MNVKSSGPWLRNHKEDWFDSVSAAVTTVHTGLEDVSYLLLLIILAWKSRLDAMQRASRYSSGNGSHCIISSTDAPGIDARQLAIGEMYLGKVAKDPDFFCCKKACYIVVKATETSM